MDFSDEWWSRSHDHDSAVLYVLQKKPPSKRGPPGMQKQGNVSDWQVKDIREAAIRGEEEQDEETQTVIRYKLSSL